MARVASCPQCEHELLVPDGTAPNAWAKCPECRAFFELQDAKAREVPTIVLADADRVEAEADEFSLAADAIPHTDPAKLHEPKATESTEAAAQRIDQWFRSAKTLEDLPPVEATAAASAPEMLIDPAEFDADNATLDLTAEDTNDGDVAEVDADFELETPAKLPDDAATWDDSQHMDQLLADLQTQPVDTYEPAEQEAAAFADDEQSSSNAEWSPEVPFTVPPGEPRRKRSIVRTMLLTVVGSVVGLALGYYALLWIRGREMDFLDVAKYLPKAALPASFQTAAKAPVKPAPPAPQPSSMADDLAASQKAAPSDPAPPSPQPTETPAEKQAAFTEPADVSKAASTEDDRYGATSAKTDTAPREPAPLESPPATALPDKALAAEPVRVADAPTFTLADLTASIQTASGAEATLAKGSLTDGREVQQAKGKSYMAIADMAQKAALVDPTAPAADVVKAESQVDDFLRRTFANAHVREELTQIVPKWLNHPKRPHNGVFLAGRLERGETKGDVNEYIIDLGSGVTASVLVPAEPGQAPNASTRAVAVAGWIVAKPADQVAGYTGTAPQAIFAKRLVPLE